MKLHKEAHAVYKTQYHIVWVTRYRRKILVGAIEVSLRKAFKEVRDYHPDWYIEETGTDKDHVHLHMIIPPKYAVSDVIESLKSNTSRILRERFAHFLKKVYWDNAGIWSTGFFVSTAGANEDAIRRYVANQGKEDAGQAKLVF